MDKARIAESLLTRISTRQQASEIIGDLLEQSPSRLRFVAAVARIAIAVIWLRALGFVLAITSIFWVAIAFLAIAFPHFKRVQQAFPLGENGNIITFPGAGFSVWDKTAYDSLLVSICMWMAAALIATWIKPSWRMSMPAFVLASILSALSWSAGLPHLTPALLILLASAVVCLLFVRSTRQGLLLALSGAVAAGAIIGGSAYFGSRLIVVISKWNPPAVPVVAFTGMMLGLTLASAFALCSLLLLHRFFTERNAQMQ